MKIPLFSVPILLIHPKIHEWVWEHVLPRGISDVVSVVPAELVEPHNTCPLELQGTISEVGRDLCLATLNMSVFVTRLPQALYLREVGR